MAVAKSKAGKHAAPLLGKYELGRLLGRGTFAKVYHARSLVGGEAVAIKVLDKPELAATAGMDARVLGEVSAMRRLRHPNVLRLHEVLATRSKVAPPLMLVELRLEAGDDEEVQAFGWDELRTELGEVVMAWHGCEEL
uniref:Protein kinase domain-containing protein n=1 Tax=Aegilops tauschii TaxID=37682 RepID=R7W973_AEGTA